MHAIRADSNYFGGFMKDQTRNVNPHAEAIAAMYLHSHSYAVSGLGCMDYWDAMTEPHKHTIREMLDRIFSAKREQSK